MRAIAKPLAAATLVAAAACCWDTTANACVVPWGARQACTNVPDPYPICIWDGARVDDPPLETCEGSFHGGESCRELGFTVPCGDRWFRPGEPCG